MHVSYFMACRERGLLHYRVFNDAFVFYTCAKLRKARLCPGFRESTHLGDVLQLRVVRLRHHQTQSLHRRIQVRLVSVAVARDVLLDGTERLKKK